MIWSGMGYDKVVRCQNSDDVRNECERTLMGLIWTKERYMGW